MAKLEVEESDIKALRRLASVINNGELTKAEFVTTLQSFVEMIVRFQNKLIDTNNKSAAQLEIKLGEAKHSTARDFATFQRQTRTLVSNSMSKLHVSAEKGLARVEKLVGDFEGKRTIADKELAERVMAAIPTITDILIYLPQHGEAVRDSLEMLKGKDRLDISAIRGVDKLEKAINDAVKTGKPISFVGGARGIYVYVGGAKKGIMNTLNFVAGSGMAIAYSKVDGLDRLTFTSSGGGATVETPAESPDGVTTVFTVSAEPKWVVADGTTYYAGQGYTYAALQVTMDVAPSFFIRVIT